MWWGYQENKGKLKLTLCMLLVLFLSCVKAPKKAKLYLASSLSVLALDLQSLDNKSIDVVFLSSSAIARQVLSKAPCDAIILADDAWRQHLLEKNAVENESVIIAKNRLVLVGPKTSAQGDFLSSLHNIPSSEKIIVGDEVSVPLGVYTKEVLSHLGLIEKLRPRLYYAHSARHASILLAEKLASWAILYQTDAVPKDFHVVASINPAWHRPIEYPFIKCKGAETDRLQAIEKLIFSPELQKAMREKGFITMSLG